MPVDINGAIVTADENGEFVVTLQENGNYEIQSGLPTDPGGVAAISFINNIFESGASLHAQSPLEIAMQRNVHIDGPVCRILQDGIQKAFFPYENTTSSIPGMPDGVPIEVPLDYSALNQMFSPVGNPNPAPAPETLFAIGKLGFARDLAAFKTDTGTDTGTYAGTWNFLGEQVGFEGLPPICEDRGDGESCSPTDEKVFDEIWRFTSRVVIAQINLANSLAGKTWKPNPANRLFTPTRGAMVLAAIRKAVVPYYNTYSCEVVAAECSTIKIDKAKIRVIFSGLYTKVPKGLESLGYDKERRKKRLEELLRKLPKSVTVCPQ